MDSIDEIGTSSRETDRLAFLLYKVLRDCDPEDKQRVLNAVRSRPDVDPGRAALVEAAISRFDQECPKRLSKRRYEEWRVSLNDKSLPSASYIVRTYGETWTKAMDALGRQPALNHAAFRLRARGISPEPDEILADLRQCAADVGTETLRFADYVRWAKAMQPHSPLGKNYLLSSRSFSTRFESFNRALVLAGLQPSSKKMGRWGSAEHYTEESAVRFLQLANNELGLDLPMTQQQYGDWRRGKYARAIQAGEWLAIPSFHTIRNLMGSWPGALLAAGLVSEARATQDSLGRGKPMPPSQIADGLLRAAKALGDSFTMNRYHQWRSTEVKNLGKLRPPSKSVVHSNFGGWKSAMTALRSALSSTDPEAFLVDVILETRPSNAK